MIVCIAENIRFNSLDINRISEDAEGWIVGNIGRDCCFQIYKNLSRLFVIPANGYRDVRMPKPTPVSSEFC